MEGFEPILITATLFTFLIIGLAAVIILSAQKKKDKMRIEMQRMEIENQKKITENTLISQENERKKLGTELHDDLGPIFGAVKSSIGRIMNNAEQNKPMEKILEIAQIAEENLAMAIGKFSDLNKLLYPVILERQGIGPALTDLIQRANKDDTVSFQLQSDPLQIKLPIISTTLYRICQELCTNAIKHSKASEVYFEIKQSPRYIHINYSDNGIGYDTGKLYTGLGLNSIRGRVEAISGKIDVRSALNEGVNITIVVPYEYQS